MTIRRSRNGKRYDNNAYILDSLWQSSIIISGMSYGMIGSGSDANDHQKAEEKNKEVEEKKDEGKKGENGKLCAEIK